MLVLDLNALGAPGQPPEFGIAGTFHGPAIAKAVRVAARTDQHVLLEGETGTGKELAARGLHDALASGGRRGPFVAHNAARFTGEDDAVTTLFGVVRGAFTGVEPRTGVIEAAAGGTLFLDEVHNLPARVQRSLLRFVEDGILERSGDSVRRPVNVRIVCGTNVPVTEAVQEQRLAHDLVARLHGVGMPPLRERRADVPSLFLHVLRKAIEPKDAAAVADRLTVELVERLCVHDYRAGNVRVLEGIAAEIRGRLTEGDTPAEALVASVDAAMPAPSTAPPIDASCGSLYENHRSEITAAYYLADGNLSRLEQVLRERGLRCNRRWLTVFLDRWGVRTVQRRA